MQTSATGSRPPKQPPPTSPTISGFTLIELMVVVVIVSVLVGATVLSVNVGDRAHAKEFTQKFTTTMHTLSTEAILSGRTYGIHWDENGSHMNVVCLNFDTAKWVDWKMCEGKDSLRELFPGGKVGLNLDKGWGVVFSSDIEGPALYKFGDVPLSEDEQYQKEIAEQVVGDEQEPKEIEPWIQFKPTGLWEPDGVMQVLINQHFQIAMRWTATGRLRPVAPKLAEEDIE